MAAVPLTPGAVADLFRGLSPEGQKACLEQLNLTAEAIFLLLHSLSPTERSQFTDMIFEEVIWQVFPWLTRHAITAVKQHPEASDEELYALVNEAARRSIEEYEASYTELAEAQLKEKRDRKSAPGTVRRNVEICDLRKQDPKKWSLGMLGKRFKLTRQTVKRILEDEAKWRRLAARL
jgi:hypothetical protein